MAQIVQPVGTPVAVMSATWPELLATALVGTARSGVAAEPLLDAVAAEALRRRAGVPPLVSGDLVAPAPVDPTPLVGPAAAARADALLALARPAREVTPVRDLAARLELLAEWLTAAGRAGGRETGRPAAEAGGRPGERGGREVGRPAAEAGGRAGKRGGRRLPGELVPALLDAGRRHRELRPLIGPVAGPLAGWLAAQRPEWGYASATPTADLGTGEDTVWELGSIERRVAWLARLRRYDPGQARELLAAAWDTESPDDRAALLGALATGLSTMDEQVLERGLDDRRRQVRQAAADLLIRIPAERPGQPGAADPARPDSADPAHAGAADPAAPDGAPRAGTGYARRMVARAAACLDLSRPGRIAVSPPVACDRAMVRDGIVARPPAGVGERAWWLEEVLARTPLSCWPGPGAFVGRRMAEDWQAAVRRGLARAAATQCDPDWAAALVDPLTAAAAASGQPGDRLLLEALYDALRPEDLVERATAVLRRGLAGATSVGVERVLALCPRPWPPAVAEAVFAAVREEAGRRGTGWRAAGLCELAALRVPAGFAPRALALLEEVRAGRPNDPAVKVLERLAATLKYRHDMLEELA